MSPLQATRVQQKIAADKALLRFHLRRQRLRYPASVETEVGFHRALVAEVQKRQVPCTLAAFLPLETEPPITGALAELVQLGHRVLVPVVLPERQLGWVRWSPDAPTGTNALGIREPTGRRLGASAFYEADLRLVPALAYSSSGRRLGQGGGYYDRLFEGLGSRSLNSATLGVVFEREILDALPADSWDAQLGFALTEKGVRRLGVSCVQEPVE